MPDGTLRANIALELAAENETELAKVAWLSKKQNGKAYKSLIAYFTKGSETQRFLHKGYMYVGRESANMSRFEPSEGPPRCYNCQVFGHKGFSCKAEKRCGYCAQTGHLWNDCTTMEPKCSSCSGPYAVNSKTCPAPHGRKAI